LSGIQLQLRHIESRSGYHHYLSNVKLALVSQQQLVASFFLEEVRS